MTQQNFEALLKLMLPDMAERAREVPATTCYRIKGERNGHYTILGYGTDPSEGLTVCILHGVDSHTPGYGVVGIRASEMERCDCGKWQSADW